MAFYPTLTKENVSLEQLVTLGTIYSGMVESLDTLQFSIEHCDWKEATAAYSNFIRDDATLLKLTGESLVESTTLEALSTESSLLEAAKSYLDKIPALIIKIAVAIIAIITAAIIYFKKRSTKGAKLETDKPLTVKGYLDSTEEAYLARYYKTEQMITKLIGILDGHVKGDLDGMSPRVREAQARLDNFVKLSKNPFVNIVNKTKDKLTNVNVDKLKKEYKRNLSSALGSLHGLYPTHLHENIGVLIVNPSSRSVDSGILANLSDTQRVDDALRHLRNADEDVLLSKFLVSVSLNVDRATSITLEPNKVKELNALIERCNHATSGLIEQFESRVAEVKVHVEAIKALEGRLASMSVGDQHKPHLREILDEVNLASKDITALIREMQALVLHLVIKY